MSKELLVNASSSSKVLLIRQDTGELVQELETPTVFTIGSDTDRYVPKLVQTEYKKINFHFVKFNDVAVHQIEKYRQHLATLAYYIHFTNGYVCYKNGKLVTTTSGIAKILSCKSTTAKTVIKYFVEQDVIHRKGKFFLINPYIISRGHSITLELYEEFKDTKWKKVNAEELE